MKEERERITPVTKMLMSGTAYSAYGLNLLIEVVSGWLGVGLVVSIAFMVMVYASFVIWFLCKGVNIFSPKLIGNFAFGAAISAIPVVNLFYISIDKKTKVPVPGIRRNIGKVIDLVQAEDKKYNESQKATRNSFQLSDAQKRIKIQQMRERRQG